MTSAVVVVVVANYQKIAGIECFMCRSCGKRVEGIFRDPVGQFTAPRIASDTSSSSSSSSSSDDTCVGITLGGELDIDLNRDPVKKPIYLKRDRVLSPRASRLLATILIKGKKTYRLDVNPRERDPAEIGTEGITDRDRDPCHVCGEYARLRKRCSRGCHLRFSRNKHFRRSKNMSRYRASFVSCMYAPTTTRKIMPEKTLLPSTRTTYTNASSPS